MLGGGWVLWQDFPADMSPHNTALDYMTLPEQRRFDRLCERVSSSVMAAGLTSSENILATLPEARNRVYARRYGKKHVGSLLRHRSRGNSPTHSQRTRMSGVPRL